MEWEEMLRLDPRLERVDGTIRSAKRIPNEDRAYDLCKAMLQQYVGYLARSPVAGLETSEAYEAGIHHITAELGI